VTGSEPFLLAGVAGAAYLAGSIPFGLLLTRFAGLGDIRRIGSGNIGATNVLRTGKKGLAAATLLLDGGKGAVVVLIAQRLGDEAALVAAAFSVLGHLFPIWLHFKGGKGVATTLGVLLAVAWPVGVAACLLWLATAYLFRYSSLAALVGIGTSPLVAWWWAGEPTALLALLLAVLVFYRHRENIERLSRGEEGKIRLKRV
jgi:glycerol-3-phosphate acyltransferase PlsY